MKYPLHFFLGSLALVAAGCSHPGGSPAKSPQAEEWCAYGSPGHEMGRHEACLDFTRPGILRLRTEHLRRLDFKTRAGLAAIYLEGGAAYVDRDGTVMRAFVFDNGPDYFSEGLARTVDERGKIGFFDRKLRIVIPPRFDFVTPFKKGRARFCEGCALDRSDPEHPSMVGGKWGAIDRKGEVVEAPR